MVVRGPHCDWPSSLGDAHPAPRNRCRQGRADRQGQNAAPEMICSYRDSNHLNPGTRWKGRRGRGWLGSLQATPYRCPKAAALVSPVAPEAAVRGKGRLNRRHSYADQDDGHGHDARQGRRCGRKRRASRGGLWHAMWRAGSGGLAFRRPSLALGRALGTARCGGGLHAGLGRLSEMVRGRVEGCRWAAPRGGVRERRTIYGRRFLRRMPVVRLIGHGAEEPENGFGR